MAYGAVNISRRDDFALYEPDVELFKNFLGDRAGMLGAVQCHDIAVHDDFDAEAVFKYRQIGVIFAKQNSRQPVVLKRNDQGVL